MVSVFYGGRGRWQNLGLLLHALLLLVGLSLPMAMLAAERPSFSAPLEPSQQTDPLAPFNRSMHAFNRDFDQWFLRPFAVFYKRVTARFFRQRVTNFFANLKEISYLSNHALQGQISRAGTSGGRFLINSSLGFFGFVDVATVFGMAGKPADFGQTLATWGMPEGPYVVLPLMGPSTLRDTAGTAVDFFSELDLVSFDSRLRMVQVVNFRAELLELDKLLDEVALSPYLFLRNSYLQRRRAFIEGSAQAAGRPSQRPVDGMPVDEMPANGMPEGGMVEEWDPLDLIDTLPADDVPEPAAEQAMPLQPLQPEPVTPPLPKDDYLQPLTP